MDIKLKASLFAISSATTLSISKFIVGYRSGSLAVVSSGLDSMLDIFMSTINFIAIKKASQPADKNHLYGHGKIEDLAAVVQALVIISTGVFIIYKTFYNYINNVVIRYQLWDMGVMGLSILFSLVVTKTLMYIGNKNNSNTLKVDALHYATDVYSNTAALVAIILAFFSKIYIFDSIFAVIIGGYISYQAVKILKEAMHILMDTSIPDELHERIEKIIENMPFPYAGYHKLRSRYTGTKKYIDFHLLVCRTADIKEAHDMAERIEEEITVQIKNIDVLIHIEPCPYDCDLTEKTCKVLQLRKSLKQNL